MTKQRELALLALLVGLLAFSPISFAQTNNDRFDDGRLNPARTRGARANARNVILANQRGARSRRGNRGARSQRGNRGNRGARSNAERQYQRPPFPGEGRGGTVAAA